MAVYYARDKEGFLQGFEVKGDQPSSTEMERINSHLNGQPAAPAQTDDAGMMTNFGRGFLRSVDEYQAGVLRAAQGLAENFGKDGKFAGLTPQDYEQMIADQYAERDTVAAPTGGFFEQEGAYNKGKFLASAAGNSALGTVGGLGGMATGAAIGSVVPGLGTIVGAGIGGLAGTIIGAAPQMLDENAQRQIQQHGYVKDWSRVAASTAGQVAVETLTDLVTAKAAGIIGRPLSSIAEEAVKRGVSRGVLAASKRVGGGLGGGAASGAVEEAVQEALTRWNADQSLGDDEAKSAYLENAIVGGILQGATGSVMGGVEGVSEMRRAKQELAAAKDAQAEADGLSNADKNVQKHKDLYTLPVKTTAGMVEDQRSIPAGLLEAPEVADERTASQPFSETEYNDAREKVRGQKVVSPDKIKGVMGIGRPKANAIFSEMLKRGDAQPAGTANQYLHVPPRGNRSYDVAQITEAEATPYQVFIKDKPRGAGFKTKEEAQAWGESVGAKAFEVRDTTAKSRPWGIYETTKNTDGATTGRQLIKQFNTPQEANEAALRYDPAFSPTSNEKNALVQAERIADRVTQQVDSTLGPLAKQLKAFADKIAGPNRVDVRATPVIDPNYLRSIGVKEEYLPAPGTIIEGVTLPDVKGSIKSVIGLSTDIYDPALSPVEKQQKLNAVLTHELVHALRNLDLLSKKEWDALTAYAYNNRKGDKPYTYMQWVGARLPKNFQGNPVEEGIAEMLRHYMENPNAFDKANRSIVRRIADFLRNLMSLGKNNSAEDVMRSIFGGEIGKRDVGAGGLGDRPYPGDPAYSSVIVPTYYLKTDKFLQASRQEKATPDQWMGMLRNAGVREEELEWLGVEDWMKEQKVVNRGDLMDFVRANAVDIKDKITTEGGSEATDAEYHELYDLVDRDMPYRREVLASRFYSSDEVNKYKAQSYHDGGDPLVLWIKDKAEQGDEEAIAYGAAKARWRELEDRINPPQPSHSGTTQPGGSDYTELLMHMPQLQPEFNVGAHFNGFPNIIASARFKTRDFGDGKKTLFIEELQSDLHQQGRKKGYSNPGDDALIEEMGKERDKINKEMGDVLSDITFYMKTRDNAADQIMEDPDLADFWRDKVAEYDAKIKEITPKYDALRDRDKVLEDEQDKIINRHGVPNAPMKTTWDEFVFKRLVRYAADNNFDQIAWHAEPDSVAHTEGYHNMYEQTNDDGSTSYINLYEYNRPEEGGIDVTGIVNFYTQRLRNIVNKTFKKFNTGVRFEPKPTAQGVEWGELFQWPEDVASFVANTPASGELSKKLRKAAQVAMQQRQFDPEAAFAKAGVTDAEMLDLMQEFYPEQAGAGGGADENQNPRYNKWVMPISPELKKAAQTEGFPMFSAVQQRHIDKMVASQPFKNWFKNSVVTDEEGLPLIVYHGTRSVEDFQTFYPYSHFGTGMAANDRLDSYLPESTGHAIAERKGIPYNKIQEWWGNMEQHERDALMAEQHQFINDQRANHRIFPVWLSIQNPIEIYDYGQNHTTDDYIRAAYEAGALSAMEYGIAKMGGKNVLTKLLEAKGYDGFTYVNAAEDMGSRSYVAFRPEQVKSVFNKGTFYPNDPRINYSAVEADRSPQYAAAAPVGQRVPVQAPRDTLADVEAKITYDNIAPVLKKATWLAGRRNRDKVNDVIDSSLINLQDRMMPIGRLIDRVRANGGFVSNENDVYLRDTLFTGQTDAELQRNTANYYNPIIAALKALDITTADKTAASRINAAAKSIVENYADPKKAVAEMYLYAQHAIERNAEMRRRNANVQADRHDQFQSGSGMTDPEATEILDWVNRQRFAAALSSETNPVSIRSLMRKLIANTNKVRLDGGLNPDYTSMRLNGGMHAPEYRDYVPLRSWIEEHMDQDEDAQAFARAGKGFNIRGKEDQSALGRSSIASDIFANAILQNEEAIVRAQKNRVGQSMLNLVETNPTEMEGTARIVYTMPMKYVYDTRTGLVKKAPDPSIMNDPMVLKVKRDGNQYYIKFSDERIAKAMGSRSGLGNAGAGAIMKSMMALNRFLAATRTSYNPEFVLSNFFRDIQAAGLNMSELELQGLRREIVGNVFKGMKGAYAGIRSGNMQNEWAQAFEEFKKMGGMTAYYGTRELSDSINKINEKLKDDPSGADPRKVLKHLAAVRDFVEDMNSVVENGIRLSAYKALRDRFLAMTPDPTNPANIKRAQERAAERAKNLTVNFNAGGEWKPFMNAMYLFYNAGIQGSAALVNPFIRSKRVRKLWGAVLIAGILQDQLMSLFSPEDDDGQKVYDKIPKSTLEHNFIFLDPTGLSQRGYFAIPLPYLMNSVFNFGRAFSRGARGGYTPSETINSALGTLAESLNPWGGTNNWLNFVAPTVLDPVVDLYTNNNFADRPIAPPANPFGVGEVDSQRYWNNTSPAYIAVADWLHRITGGDGDFLPGAIEWSPNQIDYVAQWLGGGSATFLTRAFDMFSPVGGKKVLNEMVSGGEWSANDVPFLRKFYGNVTTQNDMEAFISGRDNVLRVRNELRDAKEGGDRERFRTVMARYPGEAKIADRINSLENQRRKISGEINKIRKNSRLSDARKEQLVKKHKARQNDIIKRANKLLAGL